MKKISILILSILIVVSGCEKNKKRKSTPVPVYEMKANSNYKDEIFQDDVGISLKPINIERANNDEKFYASFKYWNPSNPRQSGVEKRRMISVPAFEVQVINSGKNPIHFGKTSVRLLDDAGNSYQAVLKQDIQDLVSKRVSVVKNNGWRVDDLSAMQAVKSLKLFDKNYEGLPGIVEKRVVAFDIGNEEDSAAYRKMMASTKYLRVVMYGVPVQLDSAGNVIKTSKFEYLFDVNRQQ